MPMVYPICARCNKEIENHQSGQHSSHWFCMICNECYEKIEKEEDD